MNVNEVEHRMQLPVDDNIRVAETGTVRKMKEGYASKTLAFWHENNAFYLATFLIVQHFIKAIYLLVEFVWKTL